MKYLTLLLLPLVFSCNKASKGEPGVAELILVNSLTGKDVRVLKQEEVIDFDKEKYEVAFRVSVNGDVNKVVFDNGNTQESPPYSLCGDNEGKYNYCNFEKGDFTIKAKAFKGEKLVGKEKIFKISTKGIHLLDRSKKPKILRLALYHGGEKGRIKELKNGDKISLSKYPDGLTIVAETEGMIGSMDFGTDAGQNSIPYSMCGDEIVSYYKCDFKVGKRVIKVKAFDQEYRKGNLIGEMQVEIEFIK